MEKTDTDEVRELDQLVFSFEGDVKRSKDNVLACWQLNPNGCFVAEHEGRIVGYAFSRIWGTVAWIGTFGVHPEFQGRGIGKRLLRHSVEFLQETNCSIIGLETMAGSNYNVGFFAKIGFYLTNPTLILKKPLETTQKDVRNSQTYTLFSNLKKDVVIQDISNLSGSVLPNLDYQTEAENALTFGWGDTLFFGHPDPSGFSILRTMSRLEGITKDYLESHVLVLKDRSKKPFSQALDSIEAFAWENDFEGVAIPVNSFHSNVINWLLGRGYNVTRIRLRMLCKGRYRVRRGIELSTWAM